jgi:hypothetical protein
MLKKKKKNEEMKIKKLQEIDDKNIKVEDA